MSEKQGIFLLGLKKSKKREGVTYCIGVFRLGTTNMEFILGETDNDREYRQGEEVSYIYDGACLLIYSFLSCSGYHFWQSNQFKALCKLLV